MRAREVDRNRKRLQRSIAKQVAVQEAESRRVMLLSLLIQAQSILNDRRFVELATSHGVSSAPRRLVRRPPLDDYRGDHFASGVLDFAIAWKFFFPLFSSRDFLAYFDARHPDFVGQMKDMFISLVMKGPFPTERSVPMNPRLFNSHSC